jgi:hypothetical protein
MNVNSVILIDNGYVLHDCCEGDVLRETTMANEKVVEGTQNGCVNLHRTSTMLDLIAQDQNNPLTQNELQSGW